MAGIIVAFNTPGSSSWLTTENANPAVADVGAKLRLALADGKLEYYHVTAKWATNPPAGRVLHFNSEELVWGAHAARLYKATNISP